MKNIFIFVILLFSFSVFSNAQDINECKTDIYYGNGVWNSSEDAKKSQKKLYERIVIPQIIKGNPLLKVKYGKTKLAYNWGQGTLLDVLETYYQLRESGQLDGVGFYTAIAALTVKLPHITLGAVATQALMEPFTKDWEQGNADEMWQQYYNVSFKLGHRVLLVSHSQGNLFANRIHGKIVATQYQNYFANFQVASPANEVKAAKGGYVTLYGDPIINPIPESMGGNANGSPGHAFVKAYLNQNDPYGKIVAGIKQLLPTLDSEISQWETDQEFDQNTCDYKITVKHRYDPSMEMAEKVYPFAANKKLYQVNGEWVKASCGGENILSDWDNKKENECWMINNPQEEKIVNEEKYIRFFIHYLVREYSWKSMIKNLAHSYAEEDYITIDDLIPGQIAITTIYECRGTVGYGDSVYNTYPFNDLDVLVERVMEQSSEALLEGKIAYSSSAVFNVMTTAKCLLEKVDKTLEDVTSLKESASSMRYESYYQRPIQQGGGSSHQIEQFREYKLFYK